MAIMIKDQFVRFLIVGVINTIFGYSVFSLFVFLGVHYALALLMATILGILFNFKTIGILVFAKKENNLIWRFFLVYTFVYGVNVLGLHLLNGVGLNIYFSGAILLFPSALLSFILNKKYVFMTECSKKE